MQMMTIDEEGLEPNLFEFKVVVHKVSNGCLFDLVESDRIPGLNLAFRLFLVDKVIRVKNTAHTSD